MPVYIATSAFFDGVESIPYFWTIVAALPWLAGLYLLKWFFSGRTNPSERNMHGKVVLVTGGTSGVGEAVVRGLASRGAQIVLLSQHALSDPFLIEYIEDIRRDSNNQLITAEQVDLANLHSVRTFATRWIDNAPPRRLDMVILCGSMVSSSQDKLQSTREGVEKIWQINYLSNFHLMSILSPALRAQPPDRDVRIVFGTCGSYMGGDLSNIEKSEETSKTKKSKSNTRQGVTEAQVSKNFSSKSAYASSKYALTTFALAFQKHLSSHKRSDGFPMNTRVLLVDPGFCRTPGTRRWLTGGSLIGLLLYMITYPLWWLILKSPEMGAQSFLFAAMEERFGRGDGGLLIKECVERKFLRPDVMEEDVQKSLWEHSEQMIEIAEKRGAAERARSKQMADDQKEEKEAIREMEDYRKKVGKKQAPSKNNSRDKKS